MPKYNAFLTKINTYEQKKEKYDSWLSEQPEVDRETKRMKMMEKSPDSKIGENIRKYEEKERARQKSGICFINRRNRHNSGK